VSLDVLTSSEQWTGVRQTLAQITACHEEFDRFFANVFNQLDELAEELTQRQQQWAAEREKSEADWQRRADELEAARAAWMAERDAARKEWEREKASLVEMLEAERSRAAELSDLLLAKERQFAEERAAWNEELQRLRRLTEAPASLAPAPAPVAAATQAAAPREQAARPRRAAPQEAVDPVLGSVLAQFEAIEREVARGRTEGVGQ
jgi:chromosome segregation ATPase